ncbi:hypothetical protein WJX75_006312 [Coccomyxa subellipsoidea]|uniref:Right handed beta helix domain-containing protein n=1 Tax=Coccomyxa subellipsoidea TaxID=248742 RepID=A0ABR2YFD7_9CHLO
MAIGGTTADFEPLIDVIAVTAAQNGSLAGFSGRKLEARGIHNGLGETVHVSKRVLIRGEGTLGETRIDHRANCPALRVSRTCLIRDLDIDMTGFREAVKIEGPAHTQPAFLNCIIRCSGDDAVNICGKAAPVLRGCSVRARKCMLTDCEEEGIVAMDKSSVRLEACTVSSCKGPAVDVTNHAQLHATGCTFKDCMGAMWGCIIQGKAYTTDQSQALAWRAANEITEPGHHIGAPPEEGPFEFVPNKYSRKQ